MNFSEAEKLLKEGKLLRRKIWSSWVYIKYLEDHKKFSVSNKCSCETPVICEAQFDSECIYSDDWEIYEIVKCKTDNRGK